MVTNVCRVLVRSVLIDKALENFLESDNSNKNNNNKNSVRSASQIQNEMIYICAYDS